MSTFNSTAPDSEQPGEKEAEWRLCGNNVPPQTSEWHGDMLKLDYFANGYGVGAHYSVTVDPDKGECKHPTACHLYSICLGLYQAR